MTRASKPVRFMVAGQRPPKVESKKRPGSGDLEATQRGAVARVVGVGAARHVVEQEPRGEPVAAEERPSGLLAQGLDAARAARDVDEEDAPAVAFHAARHRRPRMPRSVSSTASSVLSMSASVCARERYSLAHTD